MPRKKFSITLFNCTSCPNYRQLTAPLTIIDWCREVGKHIIRLTPVTDAQGEYYTLWNLPIPDWCPLPNAEEDEDA